MKPRTSQTAFLVLVLCLLLLSSGGHLVVGDEETMFRVAQNILAGNDLAVGREILVVPGQSNDIFLPHESQELPTTSAVIGHNGQLYSKYGLGQSLLAAPLLLLGQVIAAILPRCTSAATTRLCVSFLNAFALAGCAWLLVRFAQALSFRRATGHWLALAFVCASMAWPYVKTFYPQPAVTFLLLWLLLTCHGYREQASLRSESAIAIAAAGIILLRLSEVILLPLVALYLLPARHLSALSRWRGVLALVAGTGIGLAVTAWYNWYRFGSLLESGYHEISWTTPPLLGLYGMLFSPGKGVMLYTPLLVLGLAAWPLFAQRHRREALLFAGLWLALLVFYSPYNFWTGGFNWGPRFLLPVIPLGLVPIGALLDHPENRPKLVWGVFLLLFALGVCLQLPAVLVDHSRYLYQHLAGRDQAQAYTETIYELEHSPLRRQWPVSVELLEAYTQADTRTQAGVAMASLSVDPSMEGVPNGRQLLQDEFKRRNTLDFWWFHLYLQHLATAAAVPPSINP